MTRVRFLHGVHPILKRCCGWFGSIYILNLFIPWLPFLGEHGLQHLSLPEEFFHWRLHGTVHIFDLLSFHDLLPVHICWRWKHSLFRCFWVHILWSLILRSLGKRSEVCLLVPIPTRVFDLFNLPNCTWLLPLAFNCLREDYIILNWTWTGIWELVSNYLDDEFLYYAALDHILDLWSDLVFWSLRCIFGWFLRFLG